MFICHLYLFFGEMSIQIIYSVLKILLFVFLLLSYESALYGVGEKWIYSSNTNK